MKSISKPVPRSEIDKLVKETFGNLVKGVVDVEKEIMVLGGELHSDEEAMLLADGSKQKNLWGINLYPEITDENWIEFDSMINLRPSQNNTTRSVDNSEIRNKIVKIVNKLIKK